MQTCMLGLAKAQIDRSVLILEAQAQEAKLNQTMFDASHDKKPFGSNLQGTYTTLNLRSPTSDTL